MRIKITLRAFIYSLIGLVLLTENTEAQNTPLLRANFGIEADVLHNQRDFGTFTASGTDDFFKGSNSGSGY